MNIDKKLMLIVLIILVVILVLGASLKFFDNRRNHIDNKNVFPTVILSPSKIQLYITATLVPDSDVPTTPPTPSFKQGDLIISGIPVKNFYLEAVQIYPNNDALLIQNDNYKIVYTSESETFTISIIGKDFDNLQTEAENILLNLLDLSASNACRLTTIITAPADALHSFPNIQLPPSYCEHYSDSSD